MKNYRQGFTLIEIMLVVILIGILAAITVPRLSGKATQAREAAAKSEIEGSLAMSLDLYELDAGSYPTTAQGLKSLIEKPSLPPLPINWKGPYLKKKQVPRDPWGNDYMYECPGKNNEDFDLSSMGPDGIVGNEDDINNWDSRKETTEQQ
ncbi:MAG: hypothetical protein ACD_79C00825G0003 [uncultured bacterium]|nr:MAG: hypothetical protein ACD_79C00825G0003 [uncultured bacterium]